MLNFALLKHPLNWVIVVLMLVIAGFVVDILATYHSRANSNANGATADS